MRMKWVFELIKTEKLQFWIKTLNLTKKISIHWAKILPHWDLLGSKWRFKYFKANISVDIEIFMLWHTGIKKKCWGCRGTLNLFCVHLRRPCVWELGYLCIQSTSTHVFNCLTIYNDLNCIHVELQVYYANIQKLLCKSGI